jgi:hypothetical protein
VMQRDPKRIGNPDQNFCAYWRTWSLPNISEKP